MEWFDPAAIGMPPGDVSEAPWAKMFINRQLFFWWLKSTHVTGRSLSSILAPTVLCSTEDNRKKLWIPEIALQNTLKTGGGVEMEGTTHGTKGTKMEMEIRNICYLLFWVPKINWVLGSQLHIGCHSAGVEIHYPPEIVFSEKGHVAAKVLYQVGLTIRSVEKLQL